MATEAARVEVRIAEYDDRIWLDIILNGRYGFQPVHTISVEQANEMSKQIKELVTEVYREAYQAGHAACQDQIKNALGVK